MSRQTKIKHMVPAFIAFLLVIFAAPARAQNTAREPLVLQPKASLAVENEQWTFAPAVPPPITRKDQRRVIVDLSIQEGQQQIAPGVVYDDAWTFEGHFPGPILRVREGDLVEIHLTNHMMSANTHNIDFHFVSGPGGGSGALNVMPGQTAVIEARAMAPGFYMYHCAAPDMPTHISNGMYGFVIVDPAEGLPPVGKELVVVQSEIYAQSAAKGHQHYSLDRAEKADAQYIVYNGAVGSMTGANAVEVPINQPARIYVGNAGPNLISSFHLVGQIFEKVYREGDLVSPPGQYIQTTLVPAGGATVVEFTPREPGRYTFVDHSIFRMHRGAMGNIIVNGAPDLEIFNPVSAGPAAFSVNAPDAHSMSGMSATPATNMQMRMGMHGMGMGMPQSETPAPETTPAPKPQSRKAPAKNPAPVAEDDPATKLYKFLHGETLEAATAANLPPVPKTGANTVRIMPGAGQYGAEKTYLPSTLTISRGSTVTWLNLDNTTHFLRSDAGLFQSQNMPPHQTWAYTFTKPGVYHYTCVPHQWMKGTIVVR